jgi:hypothetical protein
MNENKMSQREECFHIKSEVFSQRSKFYPWMEKNISQSEERFKIEEDSFPEGLIFSQFYNVENVSHWHSYFALRAKIYIKNSQIFHYYTISLFLSSSVTSHKKVT